MGLIKDKNIFICPSPAGAYYCVSGSDENPARQFLERLLSEPSSPLLTAQSVRKLSKLRNLEEGMQFIQKMQKLGWLETLDQAQEQPQGRLEDVLPKLLSKFSDNGKILLADAQGFYISAHGFSSEVAEELSALSAHIATVHQHYSGLLSGDLGENSCAWGIIDAAGNSQTGFWPIFINKQQFMLVINGMPRLNQAALTTLIWVLSLRYGKSNAIISSLLKFSKKGREKKQG